MARPDLRPILTEFVEQIAARNTYGGNKIPESIMRQLVVEIRQEGGGVLAPYWLGVLERGRGARKSTKDHGLWKIMYKWMGKRNMFKSRTRAGREQEAKGLTWYINKYGNQQFRTQTFVDVYTTVRKETILRIDREYALAISKITMDIL